MSGAHRIEVSPNNRAGCKNTECKRKGIKIQKGQMRYGTFITGPEWQSWAWKHWGCVTPRQISSLKTSIGDDPSQLDGYEELPEEFQEKIVNALEQGHIDDEDWGWDIEMNREGKNGYFTLESKRRIKAEAQALKEAVAGEISASPSKTDDKKRGHVKDDPDAEGPAEDEPPAKKAKARTKKEQKIKNEDAEGGSKNEGLAMKNTKSTVKTEPSFKNENAEGGSENEGSTVKKIKSRIKKEPKIKDEDADEGSENEDLARKKGKAAIKGQKVYSDEANGDIEQDARPAKKGRKRAKKATAEDEIALNIKDESSDHDAPPPPKKKKSRAPRRAAAAKKIKDEDSETDGPDSASDFEKPLGNVKLEHTSEIDPNASEDAPEAQKGHKTAPKKAVVSKAEKAKKKSEPKTNVTYPRSNGRVTRSRPA